MKMALQVGGTNVIDNSRNLVNTSVDAARVNSGTLADARIPNLGAAKITTGTMATARLGSGTASATTFLRGDQTWQPNVSSIGAGQSWQAVTRSRDVWYQNTTAQPIGVYFYGSIATGVIWNVGPSTTNFISISMDDQDSGDSTDYGWIIVPVGHFYRATNTTWNNPRELR